MWEPMWETVGTAVGNVGTDRKKRVSHEIFAFIHRGFYVNAGFSSLRRAESVYEGPKIALQRHLVHNFSHTATMADPRAFLNFECASNF